MACGKLCFYDEHTVVFSASAGGLLSVLFFLFLLFFVRAAASAEGHFLFQFSPTQGDARREVCGPAGLRGMPQAKKPFAVAYGDGACAAKRSRQPSVKNPPSDDVSSGAIFL